VRRALLIVVALVLLAGGALAASAVGDQPSRYYRDAIVVEAPRELIWDVLTDFDAYEEWNPYVTRARGLASEGTELELTLDAADEEAEQVTAEVLIVHPRRKLEWRTRRLVPGLLDHEQIFRVLPLDARRFRVVQEARFEGLLAPIVDLDGERRGLADMVAALAERATARYQSASE
jgi:hypothetical protein